jgi:glycosyltransferase involved in cell wall biosynthesis
MKIGILGTRGIPNHYGGFEQFAAWLSRGLVEKGHEVFVYNSGNHPYQEKTWNGVHIIHCRENKIGTAGQFFYDLRCNKDAAKRNFDVLFHLGYSSDAIWWPKWPKNTINIVNMDGLEWKRTKYNALTRKFLEKSEAWAARHADQLIADSPAIRDHIREKYNRDAIYIPYGAKIVEHLNADVLHRYKLSPGDYYLLVARMEPENNIEMIIRGFLAAGKEKPLVIIGGTGNKFGRYLVRKYKTSSIRFEGAVYDQDLLNILRAFSARYFHGHSVGGTNPSLLEAMACGCFIAAHDNVFNKAVLGNDALYFSQATDITNLIKQENDPSFCDSATQSNFEKIRTIYAPQKVLDAYEALCLPRTL